MKNIRTMTDLQYVIDNKLDVRDAQGHIIPFVRFIMMPLINIINMMGNSELSYQPEQ